MNLPDRVGRYEVLRALGQGGMGRVLLARDTVLGRRVAIKVLRDDLGIPPEMKEQLEVRMRQEARAVAALGHPNMVTLHDMGEDPGVGMFLVFEYIDGPTLRDRIAQGPLPLEEVARLARDLGAALTHAHAAGVIHRDVKPENVMLGPTGVKVTDFGIARMPDSTLTRAGTVLGTPAYSAPEALASSEFGPLSDQFSLASTLYEAISGRRAFTGDDTLVVATRVATEEPSSIGIPAVDRVLSRAMAKDPAKRYPSCAAFGESLAIALTEPTAIVPTPVPRSSILPRATRRWHNVIAGCAVIVIVTLVVLGRRGMDGNGLSLRRVAEAFASAAGGGGTAAAAGTTTRPRVEHTTPRPPATSPASAPTPSASPSGSAAPSASASTKPPEDASAPAIAEDAASPVHVAVDAAAPPPPPHGDGGS